MGRTSLPYDYPSIQRRTFEPLPQPHHHNMGVYYLLLILLGGGCSSQNHATFYLFWEEKWQNLEINTCSLTQVPCLTNSIALILFYVSIELYNLAQPFADNKMEKKRENKSLLYDCIMWLTVRKWSVA